MKAVWNPAARPFSKKAFLPLHVIGAFFPAGRVGGARGRAAGRFMLLDLKLGCLQ